jgi:hypothetical protein
MPPKRGPALQENKARLWQQKWQQVRFGAALGSNKVGGGGT